MSDKSPHIDVVMAHFEMSEFLPEALDSILRQTHSNWTLHFVDDCSPNDDWQECINQHQDDPRIRCYRTDRNVGNYRIKNAVLPHLTGPFVAFPDADDISREERFAEQVQAMQQRRVDILGSSYAHITPDGVITKKRKMVRNGNLSLTFGYRFILLQPTMLTKLDVLQSLNGFDGTARVSADSDFVLRASHFFRIRNLRKILYLRRKHPKALTAAPGTGFGSPMRKEYQQGMIVRFKARRRLKGEELKKASLAPENDLDFNMTRLW